MSVGNLLNKVSVICPRKWHHVVLLSLLVLCICSGLALAKATVTYTWWYIPGPMEPEPPWADDFRAKHPEIELVIDPIPWAGVEPYMEKLLTQIAAGMAPDVAQIPHEALWTMDRAGAFIDLAPYMQRWTDIKLTDFVPAVRDLIVQGQRIIAVPEKTEGISAQAILYNIQYFNEAGVPLPNQYEAQGLWNWQTLREAARKVHRVDENGRVLVFGLLHNMHGILNYLEPFLLGTGSELYDARTDRIALNTPQVREAMSYLLTLIREDQVANAPDVDIYGGYLVPGKYAMWTGPLLIYPGLLPAQDYALQPQGPAARATAAELTFHTMLTGTKQHEAAATLLHYLAQAPTREEILKVERLRLPVHVRALSYAQERYAQEGSAIAPYLSQFGTMTRASLFISLPRAIQQTIMQAVTDIFAGRSAIETALEKAEAVVNAQWAELRR